MKKRRSTETGALAIEAVLALTFFLVTILSVMFMSLMVRLQANMQYAIDQAAKEISGYYYLIDKFGLAGLTSGAVNNNLNEKNKNLNEGISTIVDFSSTANDTFSQIDFNDGISFDEIQQLGDDSNVDNMKTMVQDAEKLKSQASTIMSDPKGQLQGVLVVVAKGAVNKSISKLVAPFVCRCVLPKYLAGDGTKEMLESAGLEGGLDSVDFTRTEFLRDGRSIKIVAIYQIDSEKLTLGMVRGQKFTFRQVASTAAWIVPEESDSSSKKTLAGIVAP